jgi:hypothetical protein
LEVKTVLEKQGRNTSEAIGAERRAIKADAAY